MKPISMRCNQQQWEEIKPILLENGLKIQSIHSFKDYPYLVNNWNGTLSFLGNGNNTFKKLFDRTVFEEWNKKVFLEYCGILQKIIPKYFVVKEDSNNPLWRKYIKWLNET